MRWITWRAPVLYAIDGVASNSILCCEWRGEYRFTMRWLAWQAPVHYAVVGVASNRTL